MVVELPLPIAKLQRLAFIGSGVLLSLGLVWGYQNVLGTVRTDDARLVVPSLPVVPAAQPVVSQEYGRLGRLFVREGAAVAPGDPLLTLQRDPQIDQDLVDRGIARDLAEVNEQIRDVRRFIDSLTERIVMARAVRQPLLEQQISVAVVRLHNREQLWRSGGVSRDVVDEAKEKLLKLQQERLERQQDMQRQADLQHILEIQQQRLRSLTLQQVDLRRQDLQRRDASKRHPQVNADEQVRLDYATYRSPARGVVLRLLKQPGDPVRPRETLAIWQPEQQPPQVEASLPSLGKWFVAEDQLARVEVPSLRQTYSARLLNWRPGSKGLLQVRFNLEGVPPSEARRLLSLPGEPVRVELPRRFKLLHWMQTGLTSSLLIP